jgi:H+-transporting ATPase
MESNNQNILQASSDPGTGDVATFALSMDKVIPSPKPDRWIIRMLVRTGFSLAMLLFLMSVTVFWTAANVLKMDITEIQTLVFVWLVFSGGQAALYSTRARGFFWAKPYPGRWLIIATVIDIVLTTVLATQGWLMAPIPPSLIGGMLVLAIAYLVAADVLKIILLRLAARFATEERQEV